MESHIGTTHQQEKVLKEFEEKKKLELQKSEIIDEQIEKPIITSEQIDSQNYIVPEPIVVESNIPEQIPEPQMDSEPKCGQGTKVVDGYCKVIESPKNEGNFFDIFFKIFSGLFG